jgi:hypothetical protein
MPDLFGNGREAPPAGHYLLAFWPKTTSNVELIDTFEKSRGHTPPDE